MPGALIISLVPVGLPVVTTRVSAAACALAKLIDSRLVFPHVIQPPVSPPQSSQDS